MPTLNELIGQWGPLAICLVVTLGNVGLPIPEETILMLSGYLAWQGQIPLPVLLGVGIMSAMAGDNLGYWIGRKLGPQAIERYGQWVFMTPRRLAVMRGFVTRHGAVGVFAARFLIGFRFLAGPLAGATGLRPLRFVVANLLAAVSYVPLAVGAGYAVGYWLGDSVEQVQRAVNEGQHLALGATMLGSLGLLGWWGLRLYQRRQRVRESTLAFTEVGTSSEGVGDPA
jgi:membrane protein DedA with SNARE-associated domain